MFWISALIIAAIAALILILPLLRSGGVPVAAAANDAMVYRDQLDEVGRDEKNGLIDAEEANQARAEIARRLIAASDAANSETASRSGRAAGLALAAFLCLFLPLAGYWLYSGMGLPTEPDQPLAARMSNPSPDINILIAKTEAYLTTHPDDGKAWDLLAPIYMRTMRADDAANAYRNVIRILGPDPDRLGSLGEALTVAARGQVTDDARKVFEQAIAINPKDPRSRFYVALALAQAGKFDESLAAFAALKAESPADAPWIGVIDAQVAQVTDAKAQGKNTLGNPNAADMEAASAMSAEDRMQMIRTMVDSLDAKLKDDPNNFEGWMRLVRSYGVLKETDKAEAALKTALGVFPPASDNGKALIALAKDMGLNTEGMTE
ncbi:c-type cytochrome biogenesis protein CcmI [Rhizobium alvei]|uniref:C-type cytochrome biogenesis protein CcmI n=1 Tax=Rhizobium alvei TaxID=1132659 RepID=A0ABT8YTX8_9HYPH|nr:c-type cytochrome biogenesis protein CcmI [Rhizobium alvei]MDO6966803.1 c-type cytochrome biogenesis protein CcmI [Rhizobium alvei]